MQHGDRVGVEIDGPPGSATRETTDTGVTNRGVCEQSEVDASVEVVALFPLM